MSPTPRRAATSVAALAALVLALAACSSNDDPAPEASAPPAPTISVPSGFDAQAASWTVPDLPGGKNTRTALSPDGKHFAYAYSTQEGGQYTIGQIDLETGKKAQETSTELLESDASNGNVGLVYSGEKLILAQAGTVPADGADEASEGWKATVLDAGSNTKAPKELGESVDSGESITLPTSATGPIIGVGAGASKAYYVIDAVKGSASEMNADDTESLKGCGGPDCKLPVTPVSRQSGTTVVSFQEQGASGRGCSDDTSMVPSTGSGDDGCLVGFKTSKWNSAGIAPKGAIANKASLVGAGNGYLVGAWEAKGGGTVYRTIKTSNPEASHAVTTCDAKLALNAVPQPLSFSPNGKYAVTGSLVFDLKAFKGYCFDESNGKKKTTFTAVDDSGTAWGATDSAWSPDSYATGAVTATVDGESENAATEAGGGVGLPLAFMNAGGKPVGIFAVTDDVADAPGSTVVAAYPFS